jgi:hypothetical protein
VARVFVRVKDIKDCTFELWHGATVSRLIFECLEITLKKWISDQLRKVLRSGK